MGDRAAHTLPDELEELKKRKPKFVPLSQIHVCDQIPEPADHDPAWHCHAVSTLVRNHLRSLHTQRADPFQAGKVETLSGTFSVSFLSL